MLTVICLVLDWSDDPTTTINSVTERRTAEHVVERSCWHVSILAQLTTCFPSQCVPSVNWTRLPSRRAELVFKGANWSHIEHHGQRRFRVGTSAGSNMNNTCDVAESAQTADLRQPVCLREVTSLYWMRSRGCSARVKTQFRLRGPVVCSPYGCGFRRVFAGRAEHEPHQEKRACTTTH